MDYEVGQVVKVRQASGTYGERIFYGYSVHGHHAMFCSRTEYEEAKREQREPNGIAWADEFIMHEL